MELLNLQKTMDDDRSSVSSFAIVADGDNKIKKEKDGNESDSTEIDCGESALNRNQEKSNHSSSQLWSRSEAPSHLVEIAKVSYRDLLIGIFIHKDSNNETTSRRFYFEPLAFLDPKSIYVSKSHGLCNQDSIRLTIQMWNAELRSKVLDRLRSLPNHKNDDIQEDDVCVLPFQDVQLVCKKGPQSVRLMNQSSSYLRSRKNLNFYFMCDLPSTATALAEGFKLNAEFTLESWQLTLECGGLALGSRTNGPEMSLVDHPKATFNVSTLPSQPDTKFQGLRDRLLPILRDDLKLLSGFFFIGLLVIFFALIYMTQGLQNQVRTLLAKNSTNVLPVFSVKTNTNVDTRNNQLVPFSLPDFSTLSEHVDFDLTTGIFTVKTAGTYQLMFNVLVRSSRFDKTRHLFEFQVDGERKTLLSYNIDQSLEADEYQSIHLSALLRLSSGEKVGVFRVTGMFPI